jgi:SAM-dependent methyltransferase
VEPRHQASADAIRASIQRGHCPPAAFRSALLGVPSATRDAWLDAVLGLGELYEDGPELPAGCVPYLPCSVEVLLWMIEQTAVLPSDVFVDVGSGAGRATALVHLFTGASAIGIEIQPELVGASASLASRLGLSAVSCIQGDAAEVAAGMPTASVFFFYCPFSGRRLAQVVDDLEGVARTRPLRICCVGLSLPVRSWLVRERAAAGDLSVYRSTRHERAARASALRRS